MTFSFEKLFNQFITSSMEFKLLFAAFVLFFLSRAMKKRRFSISSPGLSKLYNEVYEWVETGWSAVLLAALLMYFLVQAFRIPSGSMRTTLLEGDHLFVNKFIYGFHIPFSGGKRVWPLRQVHKGDIIIFTCPPQALSEQERLKGIKKDFIKRCIAVGGDVVEIKDKKLFVNGKSSDEPYAKFVDGTVYPSVKVFSSNEQYQRFWEEGKLANFSPEMIRDNFGPVMVPPGHYFAMGDNRDRSFDSRFWGPVPDKLMKGTSLVIYWPPKRIRIIR